MADLLIFPQTDLPAEYACQVLSFLRMEWPEGFVGENRLRSWITRPEHHPLCFVLAEAGLLISFAQVVWKPLRHAGQVYKTYGLTGVLTYPSFRQQGYGRQVVQAATDFIARSDADVAMFHCAPGLADFYAQCGWTHMVGSVTYVGVGEKHLVRSEILMMQFFSELGLRGRAAFEREPVYFDEDSTW